MLIFIKCLEQSMASGYMVITSMSVKYIESLNGVKGDNDSQGKPGPENDPGGERSLPFLQLVLCLHACFHSVGFISNFSSGGQACLEGLL